MKRSNSFALPQMFLFQIGMTSHAVAFNYLKFETIRGCMYKICYYQRALVPREEVNAVAFTIG